MKTEAELLAEDLAFAHSVLEQISLTVAERSAWLHFVEYWQGVLDRIAKENAQ